MTFVVVITDLTGYIHRMEILTGIVDSIARTFGDIVFWIIRVGIYYGLVGVIVCILANILLMIPVWSYWETANHYLKEMSKAENILISPLYLIPAVISLSIAAVLLYLLMSL